MERSEKDFAERMCIVGIFLALLLIAVTYTKDNDIKYSDDTFGWGIGVDTEVTYIDKGIEYFTTSHAAYIVGIVGFFSLLIIFLSYKLSKEEL